MNTGQPGRERGRAPGQVAEGPQASREWRLLPPADPAPLARGSCSVKEGARCRQAGTVLAGPEAPAGRTSLSLHRAAASKSRPRMGAEAEPGMPCALFPRSLLGSVVTVVTVAFRGSRRRRRATCSRGGWGPEPQVWLRVSRPTRPGGGWETPYLPAGGRGSSLP